MLGRLLLGAALAIVPTTVWACTCDDSRTFTQAQVDKAARYLINNNFIVAEVERTDKGGLHQAQQFRVKRTLIGVTLPSMVALPSEASRFVRTSCDYDLQPGFRGLAIFQRRGPTREIPGCSVFAGANAGEIGLAGLCTYSLLDNPAILRRAIALSNAQAGVSRNSRPPSSSK